MRKDDMLLRVPLISEAHPKHASWTGSPVQLGRLYGLTGVVASEVEKNAGTSRSICIPGQGTEDRCAD